MKNPVIVALGLGIVAGLAAAAPAQAVTFAEYAATSDAPNLSWTNTGAGGTLSTTGLGASAATTFSFLDPAMANLASLFTLTASSPDAAITAGGQIIEPDVSGTFSFIYTGPTTGKLTTGANLLSGTFSGAAITGATGSSVGSLQDAIVSGGTVTYTSQFETFSTTGDKGLSFELTSIVPGLSTPRSGGALNSFTAVSTGSFASDLSTGGGAGGVPEPSVWAMLLLGFAGIGVAVRRKRPAPASIGGL